MDEIISKIRDIIEEECKLGFVADWFFKTHILAVKKYADFLLERLPEANKNVVLLGVWLHDIQRIRGIKDDHQQAGAEEAGKIMGSFGIDEEIANQVKKIILTHSCDRALPESLEGRILASADAISHYANDFYLQIAVTGERNLSEFKEWALEKIERDYKKKIFFDFAKKEIEERHRALKTILTIEDNN